MRGTTSGLQSATFLYKQFLWIFSYIKWVVLNQKKQKKLFNIPNGFDPVSVIALGYQGNVEALPSPLRERELKQRERKPLSEIVYSNTFGEMDPLFK